MPMLLDRLHTDGPGNLQFAVFNPGELSLWAAVAKQNLFVRLVGRRWFVTDLEWDAGPGNFIAWVKMRSVLEAQ